MAWFDGKKETDAARELLSAIPESMKSKTPAEIKAYLEAQAAKDAEIAALKAQQATDRETLTTVQSQFASVKSKLDEIEANAQRPPNKTQEKPPDFVEDPDGAYNARATPLLAATLITGQNQARMQAQWELDNRDRDSQGKLIDGRLFRHWMVDINKEAQAYQPAALINMNTWLDIFYKIKGWRSDELNDPEARKKKYAFLETGASNVTPPQADATKKDELTDNEKKIADRMGVKHEDYLKRKKAMTFVGA